MEEATWRGQVKRSWEKPKMVFDATFKKRKVEATTLGEVLVLRETFPTEPSVSSHVDAILYSLRG